MIFPFGKRKKKGIKKIVEFPKVKDVMTRRVITAKPTDSVNSVIKKLQSSGVRGMPIVDNGKVTGMIHESDIMDWINENVKSKNPEEFRKVLKEKGKEKLSDIMVRNPITVSPEQRIEDAASLMYKHGVDRLPVVKNKKLVGIVSREDIIRGLTSSHAAAEAKKESVSTAIDNIYKEIKKHPDGIDINNLSEITGYSTDMIEKCSKILEKHGMIVVEYPITGGKILKKKE